MVRGASDIWVKLAKCCTPVPGDEIIGFVTSAWMTGKSSSSARRLPDDGILVVATELGRTTDVRDFHIAGSCVEGCRS